MPDWTYQTVFRPVLLGLGPQTGRRVAFGFMGLLSRLPLGKQVIQLMGHLRSDPRLASERIGLRVPAPVGLGCALDPHLWATPAFAEFGLGFLEIGPIRTNPPALVGAIHLDRTNESIRCESPQAALTPIAARERLQQDGPFRLPVFARIEPASGEEVRQMLAGLTACVDGFFVPIDRLEMLEGQLPASDDAAGARPPILVVMDAATWRDDDYRERCLNALRAGTVVGVVVAAAREQEALVHGKPGFVAALETVRTVRASVGREPLVVGSVGVHSPADALDYLEAGADWVQVDSGLVFAGPGLPKRINEALLYRQLKTEPPIETPPARMGGESWFWAMLMGLSMLLGGVLALIVASTRVVLPYDESMAGLTRAQLAALNDRLLPFMTHDRVTLSSTMIAVGIIYLVLAWYGIRRGLHWAYLAVILSAFSGFFSFFSFLGFGYFDPFHAFVTAVMFQFLLLTIHAHLPLRHCPEPPDLWNDGRWLANQWGQLLFVIQGAVLITAGLVISHYGMTTVFVPEDLEFMHTTAEELFGAHPQLVPLIAHDRATFGGMLIACGMATLLPALWGFRRGQAWLWLALMSAGSIAYSLTILVHWIVGYDSLMHLLPAYGGLLGLWAGGLASYKFLVAKDPRLEAEWIQRISRNAGGQEPEVIED